MAILDLVRVPDERLREKSLPVKRVDKKILRLIRDMVETLRGQTDPRGVGLAAIQVGVAKRVFLIKPGEKILVVINPEVVWVSKKMERVSRKKQKRLLEGCLSLPGHFGEVRRGREVKLAYQTLDLKEMLRGKVALREKTTTFRGLAARIVLHEMAHLVGELFIDEILKQRGRLFKVEKGKWEEVGL